MAGRSLTDFWWLVAVWLGRIGAVVVFFASTFGLAVFLLYCLGRFRYVPWR